MSLDVNNENQWKAINIDDADYVGIIEINDSVFEIVKTDKHLVFGSSTNTGLLQSGYMEIDDYFSIDENLQALIENIEIFYSDGSLYAVDIVCNDRM